MAAMQIAVRARREAEDARLLLAGMVLSLAATVAPSLLASRIEERAAPAKRRNGCASAPGVLSRRPASSANRRRSACNRSA